MTVTVTLKNEHTLRLLEELEQLGALTIQAGSAAADSAAPKPAPRFEAMRIDTKGFKFNREEANER